MDSLLQIGGEDDITRLPEGPHELPATALPFSVPFVFLGN
jgi:hypothetical protein